MNQLRSVLIDFLHLPVIGSEFRFDVIEVKV